jgi:hypothetical protein
MNSNPELILGFYYLMLQVQVVVSKLRYYIPNVHHHTHLPCKLDLQYIPKGEHTQLRI